MPKQESKQDSSITVISRDEPQKAYNALDTFLTSDITPERARAVVSVLTGKVPKEVIRSHMGAGKKMYKYIDHVWVTKQLRLAFGPHWSFEASEATIEEDGTASAKGTLVVRLPKSDGGTIEMRFTEYGACLTTTGMPMANRKLAAVSKALVRCAFRAFGMGEEFYDSANDELTSDGIWKGYMAYIRNNNKFVSQEDLIDYCKSHSIKAENLVETYEEVWGFLWDKVQNGKLGIDEQPSI
jgi:hypothetical protein